MAREAARQAGLARDAKRGITVNALEGRCCRTVRIGGGWRRSELREKDI